MDKAEICELIMVNPIFFLATCKERQPCAGLMSPSTIIFFINARFLKIEQGDISIYPDMREF